MFPYEQEPRHLQYVADLDDLNVYSVVNSRKLYGAPNDFTFCIKVRPRDISLACATVCGGGRECPKVSYMVTCVFKISKSPVRSQDLKMMCAENEQTRRCWTSAFRLFKVFKKHPLCKCFLIIMNIKSNLHVLCVSVWEAASV